jgi:hypothetical protein
LSAAAIVTPKPPQTPKAGAPGADPAPASPPDERHQDEVSRLREALSAAERQLADLRRQRSEEMARLERQAYWADRFGVDWDRVMSHAPARLAFRLLRFARQSVRRLLGRRS